MAVKIDKAKPIAGENDLKRELLLTSLENFKEDLEKEITAYDTLRRGKSTKLKKRNTGEPPTLLLNTK